MRKNEPKTKLATAAVSMLLAHKSRPWWTLNFPSGIQPIIMATTDAKNPTTIAWHCKLQITGKFIFTKSSTAYIWLVYVEKNHKQVQSNIL